MAAATTQAAGGTAGDAAMARITAQLEALNIRMAELQLEKAKKVMPAATAKQAAGNAQS